MEIQEIKRRVELLKQVTQKRTVLITDVAKELKVRSTDLMIFIQDNPGFFHTEQVWTYKNESYYEHTPFGKYKTSRSVQDKCKGLGITEVFLRPEENFRTDEFVALMQREKAKTIWVSEWNNYGTIEGHYVKPDKEDPKDEHRYHLWRNTEKKLKALKKLGILYDDTFYIGGAFDSTEHKQEYAISQKMADKARSLGWKIIGM